MKYILILTLFTLVACNSSLTSPLNQSSKGDEKQDDPSPTPPPAEPDPGKDQDKDDDKDKDITKNICYLQTNEGQTCFDFFDIDQINSAENKYNYINSFNDTSFPSGLNKWQYRSPLNLMFTTGQPNAAKIATNFIRSEMLRSNNSRGNYGFFSTAALQRIQNMRASMGKVMIINSGYRSPQYNATIGGVRFSRHTYGDAIDFKVPGKSFESVAQACLAQGAAYYQIYSNHIHCDWRTLPLNEDIYGEDLRPTIFMSRSFEDVQHTLREHTHFDPLIDFRAKTTEQTMITLRAETIQEDGGRLQYQWSVEQNGIVLFTSQRPEPSLKLKSGNYTVYLNIGGSVIKDFSLTIP